jgi:hypothetical protein
MPWMQLIIDSDLLILSKSLKFETIEKALKIGFESLSFLVRISYDVETTVSEHKTKAARL